MNTIEKKNKQEQVCTRKKKILCYQRKIKDKSVERQSRTTKTDLH